MKRITLSVVVAIVLTQSQLCLADGAAELIGFFDRLHQAVPHMNVTGTQKLDGRDVVVKRELLIDGQYYVEVKQQEGTDEVIYIANPKYQATISRKADGDWTIDYLSMNNGSQLAGSVTSVFISQVWDPLGVAAMHHDPALVSTESGPQVSEVVFRVADTLPQNSPIHPTSAGSVMRVQPRIGGGFPEVIETTNSVAQGAMKSPFKFSSLVSVAADLALPSVVKAVIVTPTGERRNPATFEWDYSRILDPIDRDRCFLSYYGLPEPGSSNSKWLPWLAFMLVAVVIFVLVRRQLANRES